MLDLDVLLILKAKDIIEIYPELNEKDLSFESLNISDYDPLFKSFGYEIVLKVDDQDYSGDSRIIFKNADQFGLLIFGWGSCSGCDFLRGCKTINELEDLRFSLHRQIIWNSASKLHQYIDEKDWDLDFSWNATETKDFVKQAKELLLDAE